MRVCVHPSVGEIERESEDWQLLPLSNSSHKLRYKFSLSSALTGLKRLCSGHSQNSHNEEGVCYLNSELCREPPMATSLVLTCLTPQKNSYFTL